MAQADNVVTQTHTTVVQVLQHIEQVPFVAAITGKLCAHITMSAPGATFAMIAPSASFAMTTPSATIELEDCT